MAFDRPFRLLLSVLLSCQPKRANMRARADVHTAVEEAVRKSSPLLLTITIIEYTGVVSLLKNRFVNVTRLNFYLRNK